MKKIKILFTIALGMSFAGCLKDDPNVDFSNTGIIAEISSSSLVTDNSPTSGIDYFKKAVLPYIGSDSAYDVTFNVNIASEYPLDRDVAVTVAIDDAKRVAVNSSLAPAAQYVLPDATNFNFPVKTAIIKAGSRLAKFTITFYGTTLDPVKNYMLPVTLTDASGLSISGNLSTFYLHSIGNLNAGPYGVVGTRTNYNGAAANGSIASVADLGLFAPVKTGVPENSTVIDIDYANLGPSHYIITFNADGTAVTAVKVDDDFTASVSGFAIDLYSYDLTTRTIHVKSHYTNSAGNDRIIEEFFKHQ